MKNVVAYWEGGNMAISNSLFPLRQSQMNLRLVLILITMASHNIRASLPPEPIFGRRVCRKTF